VAQARDAHLSGAVWLNPTPEQALGLFAVDQMIHRIDERSMYPLTLISKKWRCHVRIIGRGSVVRSLKM
jgi:uncharacterized protein with von Willebrand factor type A (vWA) domain